MIRPCSGEHERDPVDVVDVGEAVDVALGEPRHRREEAVVLRLVGDPGVELDEDLAVLGPDRPDVRGAPVAEQDVGLPVRGGGGTSPGPALIGVDVGHTLNLSVARWSSVSETDPACPCGSGGCTWRESAPWHAARRSSDLPDDFEEHILDTDIGDEMRVVVPRVRLLRHLLPGAARRPRRAQAGAAPDPLHDERHGPAPRPRPREERPRRR